MTWKAMRGGKPTETQNDAEEERREEKCRQFSRLFSKETCLKEGKHFKVEISSTGEPFIKRLTESLCALAVSGGGIRSAVFNLGILLGLAKTKLLGRINIVSTVSGGGFTVGFWMAWLHHHYYPGKSAQFFPDANGKKDEQDALNQLRAYANYLTPRPGLISKDGLTLWLHALPLLTLTLIAVNALFAIVVFAFMAIQDLAPVVAHSASALRSLADQAKPINTQIRIGFQFAAEWAESCNQNLPLRFAPWTALIPGILCAVALLSTSFLRVIGLALIGRPPANIKERRFCGWLASRTFWLFLLALAFMVGNWSAPSAIEGGKPHAFKIAVLVVQFIVTTLIPLATILSRHVLIKRAMAKPKPNASAWPIKLTRLAIKAIPIVIIFAGMALSTTLIIEVLHFARKSDYDIVQWIILFAVWIPVIIVLLALWRFHPTNLSMHPLFRSRIARAFLGSARPDKEMIETAETPLLDDLQFADLDWQKAQEGRLLHLVCATANDIGGEPLMNYNKGGRSVVLSRYGLWCDGSHREWAPGERMTLSTALTISSAAFNSQMGVYTARLGKGFAFLLSALNLRLGCWVRHPNHPPKWKGSKNSLSQTVSPSFFGLPGSLFFRELFSDTRVERRRYIHLSDGGHFENLGLYELVRRHCQYIIVSEAGTDPEAASADLAHTLWRIQADFGIKIKIDVSGFTPDESGETEKHVAIGSIHYTDNSEGVLIYLRTGITGDEPVEVERYRKANPSFPYESTADQFFDPEQWEAYRALGQHIGEDTFEFLSKRDDREGSADALGETLPISRIFQDTRWTWTRSCFRT